LSTTALPSSAAAAAATSAPPRIVGVSDEEDATTLEYAPAPREMLNKMGAMGELIICRA
jgi:hypothetical protein